MDVDATFDVFYRGYRPYVQGLCRKRSRQVQDTCELESIVWFDVYQHFPKYQEGDPRTLLYRLVSWRANDLYRKQRRDSDAKDALQVEDQALLSWLQMGSSVRTDEQMAIREALLAESEGARELLFGRFIEGLTWEELGARCGCHRNTAQKQIQQSIKRLRARLQSMVD